MLCCGYKFNLKYDVIKINLSRGQKLSFTPDSNGNPSKLLGMKQFLGLQWIAGIGLAEDA